MGEPLNERGHEALENKQSADEIIKRAAQKGQAQLKQALEKQGPTPHKEPIHRT